MTYDPEAEAKYWVSMCEIEVAGACESCLTIALIRAFNAGVEAGAEECDAMSGWRDWDPAADPEIRKRAPTEVAYAADLLGGRIRALKLEEEPG